jgi:hypothetical protein
MVKYAVIILGAFVLMLSLLSGVVKAQTETPTPTPSAKPSQAPKTGMGYLK